MILTVTLNAAIDKRYVIEDFKLGEINRIKECRYTPGGKGLNVAKAVVICGSDALATGIVGGHAGDYIEENLRRYGVESAFYHVKGESRSCMNVWDDVNCVQTEFLEPGFTVTPEEFDQFLDEFKEAAGNADVVTMSGSVPMGLDGTAYQKLVSIVNEEGKPVILDTSGKLLEEGIKAKPAMIKPNIDEIRMLTGKKCDDISEIADAAVKIHEDGIPVVVVSLGSEGSLAVGDEGAYRAVVPKIDAVNTVGCGDLMTAGFALGFEKGLGLCETLKTASAISAAGALTDETGFFKIEDMERIYPEIRIEELAN